MRNIIRLTNDFILRAGVHALPLRIDDLSEICKHLGYQLMPYQRADGALRKLGMEQYTAYPAFTVCIGDSKAVLFDSTLSTGTRIFAIAHEIGHIVLQHNYNGVVGFTNADSDQEREANTFAYQLIAPLCILKALNVRSVLDIQSETLLDRKRARYIHHCLRQYIPQPCEAEMIEAYGIVQPQRKFDFVFLPALLMVLLLAITLILRKFPDPQPTVETTQSFFLQMREQQQPQTEEIQTTASAEQQSTTASPEQGETVYITKSGERYHKPDCYHIKNSTSVTAVPLSDAIDEGYTACKSCYK